MTPVEIRWRDVVGFPGYEVSDAGDVRSRLAAGFGRPPEPARVLSAFVDTHGYRKVHLRRDGRRYPFKVAALVLTAFVGPRPDHSDACHNDGNRANDALKNLRWDSRKGNLADCLAHGTRSRGERAGTSRLREVDVRAIRSLLDGGESQRSVARWFNVAQSTVSKINRKERWGWLT